MLADFIKGLSFLTEGTRAFYRDSSLWKYAALPLAIMAVVYAAILGGTYWGAMTLAQHISAWAESFPDWLAWAGTALASTAIVISLLLVLAILFTALTTLYEFFGGFFFDYLMDAFNEKHFGFKAPEQPFSLMAACMLDSLLYCLKTLLVMLLLFAVGPVPILGQILFCGVMGYMYGMSFLLIAGFRHGLRAQAVKTLAKTHGAAVMGYGLTAYLILMLVPFAIFVILPGMALGAVILLHYITDNQNTRKITGHDHD